MVRQFHDKFSFPVSETPAEPSEPLVRLRQKLLTDEVAEVAQAVELGDLKNLAQELADVVYVAYGTALTYGIDLDVALARVHKSNMTRSGSEGGKAVKGPGYEPPDLSRALGLNA